MFPRNKFLIALSTIALGSVRLSNAFSQTDFEERCRLLQEETDIVLLEQIARDRKDPCNEAALQRLLVVGPQPAATNTIADALPH